MKNLLLIVISIFCSSLLLHSQETEATAPIVFIYDASGSMWGQIDGKTKMEIASSVLSDAVDKLPENQQLGLVAYGHRQKGDCEDVEFLVNMDNLQKDQVKQALKGIKPLGKTPLAYSATQVIDKLRATKGKATIILVTDGIESCNGNICDVIRAAKAEGIEFKLHIVGFGLKEGETEQLECAAKAGDGQYYDAADVGELTDVLNEVTHATVDKPAANFSVYALKNGKAVDAYIKVKKQGESTSKATARTYQDTAFFYLPPGTYDLIVSPLENTDIAALTVTNVTSLDDQMNHQTVSFDGGKIVVRTLSNGEGWDATVKIFPAGGRRSVAGGRTYGRDDTYEVNPGLYDVEVLALVMNGLETTHRWEKVDVKANQEIEVEHDFPSGVAMIGAKSGNTLVDAVIRIVEVNSKTNVAGGRTYTSPSNNPKKFILNPGSYEVTLSGLADFAGQKKSFIIQVAGGETTEKIGEF